MRNNSVQKEIVLLHGEIKSPPLSIKGRKEIGYLLGQLQRGAALTMPQSRPLPSIGTRCHELRVNDDGKQWRVIYRLDEGFIVVADVFLKKTPQMPQTVKDAYKLRYAKYDRDISQGGYHG